MKLREPRGRRHQLLSASAATVLPLRFCVRRIVATLSSPDRLRGTCFHAKNLTGSPANPLFWLFHFRTLQTFGLFFAETNPLACAKERRLHAYVGHELQTVRAKLR